MRALRLLALAFVVASLLSCHKPRRYTPQVELTRLSVVRKDKQGNAVTLDAELTYFDCPGTQIEVVSGGKDFAACMAAHKVGERVPIVVEQRWRSEGHYHWSVEEIAGCKRPAQDDDEASYSIVRACEDWKVNGATVGFQCQVEPDKALAKKCPWFTRD